jgi:Protein of unknown function (DUF1320)
VGPGGAPYVTPAQLALFAPAALLALATGAQQEQACLHASETLDSYFRGRYALPLLAWGNDVVRFAAYIALYELASGVVGFAPQAGSDANVTTNYYSAVGWPDKPGTGWGPGVQRQAIHPDVTPSTPQPGDAVHDVPQVFTSPKRGWNSRFGRQVVG